MFALAPCLDNLLSSLPSEAVGDDELDALITKTLDDAQQKLGGDRSKTQWEFLLKQEVMRLAATEGTMAQDSPATSAYYAALCTRLDIVLTFAERDAIEGLVPFSILQDLLETQTVASCSHIFSWIEARSARLTEGLVPQKGKALVLLRMLNDLLRRLSKTGSTTRFCGRILTFLSGVFPLGERSGVNLRGEYGSQWEPVVYRRAVKDDKDKMEVDDSEATEDVEMKDASPSQEKTQPSQTSKIGKAPPTKPAADKTEEEKKEDFFNTFWSLQLPFSRPPLFAQPTTLPTFKTAVNAVMPVIKEATVKERALMGSKAVVGSKRKREATPLSTNDETNRNYFFAKYLTSPELLDLEIADTSFRRQFLFQLLIVLTHLLQFTKTAKAEWMAFRNRSLHMDFTLEPDDVKWVTDTISKTYEELRQTAPNGRAFADTVQAILERERNWVRWKNDLCAQFDKEPLKESMWDQTRAAREKMREDAPEWKHKLGSEALTEIWAMGYRDLADLQMPFIAGDVRDFVKDIEKENGRIALRKRQIQKQAQMRARLAASASASASAAPPAGSPVPSGALSESTSAPAGLGLGVSTAAASIPVAPSPQRPVVPAPTAAARAASPLHPSLPPRPGGPPAPAPVPNVQPHMSASTSVPAVSVAAASQPVHPPATPPVQPATPTPAPTPIPAPELNDPMILKAEENKQRISWLALRTARDEYLHLFGRIADGDVLLLAQEIEKEKSRLKKGEGMEAQASSSQGSSAGGGAVAVRDSGEREMRSPERTQASTGPGAGEGEGQGIMDVEEPGSNSNVAPEGAAESGPDVKMEEVKAEPNAAAMKVDS